jgi:hypothetical protein
MGCLSHPGARAYLNKSVIEELERLKNSNAEWKSEEEVCGAHIMARKAIALLKGDGK